MDRTDRHEKPKKKAWRIVGFTILGIVLIGIITAILIVNGLFKSLKETPADRVEIQHNESVKPVEAGNLKDSQSSAADAVDSPVPTDGNDIRTIMVSEETLDSIDNESETAILDAIQENLANMPDTDGVYSVLLIGIDIRDIPLTERTDCIFLASINQNTNQLILTSFPQNLYVYISDWDSTNCLHVVNTLGGPELTMKTIEQNFGVAVDAYASITFDSFARAVDDFGGVEMPLSAVELERVTVGETVPQEIEAGVYRLNGDQVLAYCANSTDHTGSRFTVIRKLWEQSRHASLAKRYEVAQRTLKDVSTTITLGQCLNLLMDITDLHKYQMISVSLPEEGLYESRITDDAAVLIPDTKANTAYIRELIYGTA